MNKVTKKWILILMVLQTLVVANEAIGCETNYPSTPQEVVEAYLKEDFTRGGQYWERISKFTTWKDGPGWDVTILISGYSIKNTTANNVNANVEVEYKDTVEYSYDAVGPVIGNKAKKELVIFTVTYTDGCWKIESPQNPPHLSATYIIEDLQTLTAKSKKKKRFKEIEALNELQQFFGK